MQLIEWLEQEGVSQASFAKQINVSQPTLGRFANGRSDPSVRIANEIERVTNGAVRPRDWDKLSDYLMDKYDV